MARGKSKVLHGEGTPRIVIPEDDNTASGTIISINGFVVTFSEINGLSSSVLNKQLIADNNYAKETKGKIIAYNSTNKTVTVKEWDNEPAIAGSATIKNEVIDLPFTEELYEWYTLLFEPPFTKYHNKEKVRKLEGVYYNCILNYESYMLQETLASMQNIFNANRTNNFWFMPRVDNMRVYYKCELADESILETAQLKYYQGHKYVKIELEGLVLLDGPNLRLTKDNIVMLSSADGTIVTDAGGSGIS